MKKLFIIISFLFMFSCSLPEDNILFSFDGSWKITKVYSNGNLVNPQQEDCFYETIISLFDDETFTEENYSFNTNTQLCEPSFFTNGTYFINDNSTITFDVSGVFESREYEILNENSFHFLDSEVFNGETFNYITVYERQ